MPHMHKGSHARIPCMPPDTELSVIIVSYNTRDLTLRCLADLYADLGNAGLSERSEVIVVDNASGDGSADAILQSFPQVHLIASDRNLGFGAANNRAMAVARGELFLLLNSDAFLHPGAIRALIDQLATNPRTAAVGCRLLCPDGSLQVSCFRYPTPLRAWLENLWIASVAPPASRLGDFMRWPHDAEADVDFVIGACMLVRASVYREVGGFDESFFLYAEETDWQYRMKRAGWRIAFTPRGLATHVGGASGAPERARINRHFFNGLDRFVRKHFGLGGLLLVRMAMVVGCSARAMLWTLMLVNPGRRSAAIAKLRLHAWLVWRQLTLWRLPASAMSTTRSA